MIFKRSFVQQGLHRAQQLATNAGMKHMILKAVEQRQAGIVTPVLFECALLGDAEKLFCTLEDGDDVNPVVNYDYWSIILHIVWNSHVRNYFTVRKYFGGGGAISTFSDNETKFLSCEFSFCNILKIKSLTVTSIESNRPFV